MQCTQQLPYALHLGRRPVPLLHTPGTTAPPCHCFNKKCARSPTGTQCSVFARRFVELWDSQGHTGDLYPAALYGSTAPGGDAARRTAQDGFMARLLADSLQFAGAFMIRRLVGIAHVADMDTIADPDVRAACERRALRFGRWLLVEGHVECTDITHITRGGGARGSSSRPHLEDA